MSSLSTICDSELVVLLKQDSKEAYTEIYDRYHGILYAFSYKKLNDREEAKDLIHELFLSLWERRNLLDVKIGLAAYLFTAVRNRVLNLIKHKKVSSVYVESFQLYMVNNQIAADEVLQQKELTAFIEKEIQALPYKMRMVFELSRKDHYTRVEIAQELNLSEETVKSHMHHALKILRVKLGSMFFLIFLIYP
ncbi:RNA polymerase ECF-type sigma factor [Arcticibacter svalbardensis MN12-7]|uniref:RNA polymerase ECF-type sigma factor n=1 Tax=Arcticibacter svalbardensis MN12-7 TaxID=1150600 RepID=R9GME4_9SPHI|nr:RNA polymerase sigma-70 factor [Arcticibacter svalbardensis]EOR92680.1 RNA polymerase ECF-type sigma factor [Arcticibacter svalbardensis MN12-7]